jgi:glyoxylase-like metal-dependent hydrolase (beta-lactamase superfamily II)
LVGLLVVLALMETRVGATPSYPDVPVEMTLRQLSEHVYYVEGRPGAATENEGFVSNAGVVVTPEGVVVFDSLGSPPLAWKLVRLIREKTSKPIKMVVVSHYHADHIYGLQVFKELGAKIIGPRGAMDYLGSPEALERLEERRLSLAPWVDERTRLIEPDELVSGALTFELGGVRFQVIDLGKAHSDGDLAMLVEPDRVLFSGDVIFQGRIPWVGDADTRRWLAVLEDLERQGVKALVPGHGPASSDPAATISLTRRYLAFLREHMGAAVEEFVPFDEAYAQTDWSAWQDLPAFEAANRINAYQVYLAMEAELLAE